MQSPNWEGAKETARWVVLFVISWIITETVKQLGSVPENLPVHIWVFAYNIPVQLTLSFLLALAGRWVDKALFVSSKQDLTTKVLDQDANPKGLLPF